MRLHPLPRSITFVFRGDTRPPDLRSAFAPAPRLDGWVDFDLERWPELPKVGEHVTLSYGSSGTLSLTVKYRRRYPDRDLARLWFADGKTEHTGGS